MKFLRFVIVFFVLALMGPSIIKLLFSEDPAIPVAKQFVLGCPEVIELNGKVATVNVNGITYVEASIDYSGKETPTYNIYRFYVATAGTLSGVFARVKVSNLQQGAINREDYELSCL